MWPHNMRFGVVISILTLIYIYESRLSYKESSGDVEGGVLRT